MNSSEHETPETVAAAGRSRGLTARERSRRRKALYLVAIIGLIAVLFSMGYPATVDTAEKRGRPGGWLAQYRDKHELSQVELGVADPTSVMVALGTLGMRGLGSSLLWAAANEDQMKKDWTSLRATLDLISKFQPHSIDVWRYQAWNLSYNVSVAFDDYHDKFYWVIQGLNFMLDGIHLNDKVPRLYWDMGWFISNKIGRADEAKYYRRLFMGRRDVSESDTDFRHSQTGTRAASADDSGQDYTPDYVKDFLDRDQPPTGFPRSTCSDVRDNWHVGKAWFLASESKINPPRYPVKGMADVIFWSYAPNSQFYYADNLEKDGYFDQKAAMAWKQATREWHEFGEKAIDRDEDVKVQLNHEEELEARVARNVAALDALVPGEREKLKKEKYASLTPEQREAWDAKKRSPEQDKIVMEIADRMDVKDDEVFRRAAPAKAKKAKELVERIEADRTLARYTKLERDKVNFVFWRTRAEAEQSDDCIAARKAINDGDEAFAQGDQIRAVPYYERGMRLWRKVLGPIDPKDPYYAGQPQRRERYTTLVEDPSFGGDLMDVIKRYQKCLDQDDRDLPKPFILQDIIDKHGRGG